MDAPKLERSQRQHQACLALFAQMLQGRSPAGAAAEAAAAEYTTP